MNSKSYKDLIIWQKSIYLVELVYSYTQHMPKTETFALAGQMQRAAISIPSNIAEGQQRNSLKEYIQFLSISRSSLAELETQLIISKKIYKNIDSAKIDSLLLEIQKMINVLIKNLKVKI